MEVELKLIVELKESDMYDIYLEDYNIEDLSINHFNISEDVKNRAWYIYFNSSLGMAVLKNKGRDVGTYLFKNQK